MREREATGLIRGDGMSTGETIHRQAEQDSSQGTELPRYFDITAHHILSFHCRFREPNGPQDIYIDDHHARFFPQFLPERQSKSHLHTLYLDVLLAIVQFAQRYLRAI